MKLQLTLLATILSYFALAQNETQIPGSDLYLQLTEECEILGTDQIITCENSSLTIMLFEGVDFNEEKHDFDNIEADYKEKGIKLLNKSSGKLGPYDAIFLELETIPALRQIVFGNELFFAIINIVANEAAVILEEEKYLPMLRTIKFKPSDKSPLEEHAKFKFDEANSQLNFWDYTGVFFAFEDTTTQTMLMVISFPATAGMVSDEAIVAQFTSKMGGEGMQGTILEKGELKTENFDGYFEIITIEEAKENDVEILGFFVTSATNGTMAFQFMMVDMPDPKSYIIEKLNDFSWK